MKDHKNGTVGLECPKNCGAKNLPICELGKHLLKLDEKICLQSAGNVCKNQEVKCRKCDEVVKANKIKQHHCFLLQIIQSYKKIV